MCIMDNVTAVILGGGRGNRLQPLTNNRCKPAVSFGGRYRLVDIPISNCLNSGLNKIFVLTQFNSFSLNRHINRAYRFDHFHDGFVEVIAAEQTEDTSDWFQGTADAVRKVISHLKQTRPQHVIILSGDQLYQMDLKEMLKNHLAHPGAMVSIATKAVSGDVISELGILKVMYKDHVVDFYEKPQNLDSVASFKQTDGKYLSSMGIYVFNYDYLIDVLNKYLDEHDFGKNIIPRAIADAVVLSYEYKGYWEDIGTIRAFFEANLCLTWEWPPINLYDSKFPFYTHPRNLPPTKFLNANINKALIAEGGIINVAHVQDSVIGIRSVVQEGTELNRVVMMGADYYGFHNESKKFPLGIGKNCKISNCIIDKNCSIGDNVTLINEAGHNVYQDEYVDIRDGIIVVPKEREIPSGYRI